MMRGLFVRIFPNYDSGLLPVPLSQIHRRNMLRLRPTSRNPAIDPSYDWTRCHIRYPGRDDTYGCEDIESITVEGGTIKFAGTWSNICANGTCVEQTYAM